MSFMYVLLHSFAQQVLVEFAYAKTSSRITKSSQWSPSNHFSHGSTRQSYRDVDSVICTLQHLNHPQFKSTIILTRGWQFKKRSILVWLMPSKCKRFNIDIDRDETRVSIHTSLSLL